jgi:hypothetical protein
MIPNHKTNTTLILHDWLSTLEKSSAEQVFLVSTVRLGMFKSLGPMLSDECWCLNGRWGGRPSFVATAAMSNFNLFRCCLKGEKAWRDNEKKNSVGAPRTNQRVTEYVDLFFQRKERNVLKRSSYSFSYNSWKIVSLQGSLFRSLSLMEIGYYWTTRTPKRPPTFSKLSFQFTRNF